MGVPIIHCLNSKLDFSNLGDDSDENTKRFHQDIARMEKRHEGVWSTRRQADLFWRSS